MIQCFVCKMYKLVKKDGKRVTKMNRRNKGRDIYKKIKGASETQADAGSDRLEKLSKIIAMEK